MNWVLFVLARRIRWCNCPSLYRNPADSYSSRGIALAAMTLHLDFVQVEPGSKIFALHLTSFSCYSFRFDHCRFTFYTTSMTNGGSAADNLRNAFMNQRHSASQRSDQRHIVVKLFSFEGLVGVSSQWLGGCS